MGEDQGFDLTVMLNGIEVTFRASEVDEDSPPGTVTYCFDPKEADLTVEERGNLEAVAQSDPEAKRLLCLEDNRCEVCGLQKDEETANYLSAGKLRRLCTDHAGASDVKIEIDFTRIPKITLEDMLPSLKTDQGEGERQAAHKLMRELEAKGLTRKQISAELTRLGYQEVSERTVAKHLRDECACFKAETVA